MTQKSCGACANYLRFKSWCGGKDRSKRSGICNLLDYNLTTDSNAKDCKYFMPFRYKRIKKHNRKPFLPED